MYKKFSEFKELKENLELFQKFDLICETIVLSNIKFDEFWTKQAMPVLLENSTTEPKETLDQILNEFLGMDKVKNWFNRGTNPSISSAGGSVGGDTGMSSPSSLEKPSSSTTPDHLNKKAENIVNPIKQLFAKKIKEFKGDAQRLSMNSPSQHHAWKAAELLSNSADKWLQSWMPKVSKADQGGPGYANDYKNAYQQHQDGLRKKELAGQEGQRNKAGITNNGNGYGLAHNQEYGSNNMDQRLASRNRQQKAKLAQGLRPHVDNKWGFPDDDDDDF